MIAGFAAKPEVLVPYMGCVMNLTELGCDESMLETLADATFVMEGGYRKLTREEIITIFRESL